MLLLSGLKPEVSVLLFEFLPFLSKLNPLRWASILLCLLGNNTRAKKPQAFACGFFLYNIINISSPGRKTVRGCVFIYISGEGLAGLGVKDVQHIAAEGEVYLVAVVEAGGVCGGQVDG